MVLSFTREVRASSGDRPVKLQALADGEIDQRLHLDAVLTSRHVLGDILPSDVQLLEEGVEETPAAAGVGHSPRFAYPSNRHGEGRYRRPGAQLSLQRLHLVSTTGTLGRADRADATIPETASG